MRHVDVFNGGADGLCALHQLRLVTPLDAILITGVKRAIALLDRVAAVPGDSVTVLDISLDVNRTALLALLDRNITIDYLIIMDRGWFHRMRGYMRISTPRQTSAPEFLSIGILRAFIVSGRWPPPLAITSRRRPGSWLRSLALTPEQLGALQ